MENTATDFNLVNAPVIAVEDNSQECGAIVWWSLTGSVNYEEFASAWASAEMPRDLFMGQVSPTNALRRALADLQDRRRLVRPLSKRGHFAVVEEVVDGDTITHQAVAIVRHDKEKPVVDNAVEAGDERVAAIREEVNRDFLSRLENPTHADVSYWLIGLARKLGALSLRERGGMYFVPKSQLPFWREVTKLLRKTMPGSDIYEIPAMRTEEAVAAILDALQREAEQEIADFELALETDGLGGRALNNRVDRCSGMRAKVRDYERILGASLEELQTKLTQIEGQLAVAALTASNQGEA